MDKGIVIQTLYQSLMLKKVKEADKSSAPEPDKHLNLFQHAPFLLKPGSAGGKFSGTGFVARGQALHRIADIQIMKFQPVIRAYRICRCGTEPGLIQEWIHEISGSIPGKGAPGAICPMGSGGKADEPHPCIEGAESGHGPVPVVSLIQTLTGLKLLHEGMKTFTPSAFE
jgi:hypothetical protein